MATDCGECHGWGFEAPESLAYRDDPAECRGCGGLGKIPCEGCSAVAEVVVCRDVFLCLQCERESRD